jgi:two-component system response regulator HydG
VLSPTGKTRGPVLPVLHLMVVDEDDTVRDACLEIARGLGYATVGARNAAAAREMLVHLQVDVLLLDLKTAGAGPRASGLDLLEEVKAITPETLVIVMTAYATVSNAVEAMRVGAGDYLTKPFALEELVTILERAGERRHFDLETRRLRERLRTQQGASPLIGRSMQMEKLYRMLSKVASAMHPVLIAGEAGTGKELVARSIHFNGPRAHLPFVPVDCGSLMPSRMAGELFGYVRGGIAPVEQDDERQPKVGLLSAPDGATVLLDEIGELSLEMQAKLLRALQERVVQPVGSEPGATPLPLTARILAATNRDLVVMVEQGRFRKDLYFRLNVVTLRIPPLRERREDISLLAEHSLERSERASGVAHTFSDEAFRAMLAYDWPGNVRELENAVERACALSSGPVLHMGDLPTQLHDLRRHRSETASGGDAAQPAAGAAVGTPRIVSIAEMEHTAILGTIRQLKGDKLMAAKLLGIGKTTLYRKLKEYGISDDSFNE